VTATATVVRDRLYARGVMLVLLAGIFWSLAGIFLRNLEAATAWQVIVYRSGSFALMLGIILAARYRGRLGGVVRRIGGIGVFGGLAMGTAFTGMVMSMMHTTVANALFIFATAPFFAALLGWLILRERVPALTWAAIAAALTGVGIMVADGLTGDGMTGILWSLTMPLAFAALIIALRRKREVDMLPMVCLGGIVSALAGAALADSLAISLHDLAICVILGTVQIGCGMLAFTAGARHVPAAELGLLAMTEAVLGPIWVWLGVGEVPSGLTLVGGAVVMSAIVAQAVWGMRNNLATTGGKA
jgi:drug/metabolite transporter (DMT)-like permease